MSAHAAPFNAEGLNVPQTFRRRRPSAATQPSAKDFRNAALKGGGERTISLCIRFVLLTRRPISILSCAFAGPGFFFLFLCSSVPPNPPQSSPECENNWNDRL